VRLIGRKLEMSSAPSFWGKRAVLAELRVKPMKVRHMKIAEEVDGAHLILTNNAPTMLIESSGKPIRP
jgi:hypothetical protein